MWTVVLNCLRFTHATCLTAVFSLYPAFVALLLFGAMSIYLGYLEAALFLVVGFMLATRRWSTIATEGMTYQLRGALYYLFGVTCFIYVAPLLMDFSLFLPGI